ncbi:hypothetical protein KAT55_02920 [Candidatus Bathyarchaeota archaeon]|nr:hypothetical protein [Candidatus Bathyarchaeota archaeon]
MVFGNLIGLIIINIVLQTPALWYSGRRVLGIDKVEFKDAVKITAVYTVINAFILVYVGAMVAGLIQIIAYLYVVKKYYDTTWNKAAIISLVMISVNILITFLLMGPGLFLYLR